MFSLYSQMKNHLNAERVNYAVAHWNGSDRATTYVNKAQLTALISAADVSAVGAFPVTVYDPAGDETAAIMFQVWDVEYENWLPVVGR
jgi:hypothetical protein